MKIKSKLLENLGLKVTALILAILLWFIVVRVDDPVMTESFRDIPVQVTNAEVVTNTGKVYQIINDTQTVTVEVSAPRSVLSEISASDIIAEADLREMELETLVPVNAYVTGHENESSAKATPGNIQVMIEDQTRNTFPVTVETTGTLRDSFVLGEVRANPETITIRGGESSLSRIERVVARVDVTGLSKDTTLQGQLLLYDGEGNEIDQTLLSNNLGGDGLTVNVQVLPTKTVPLSFEVAGEPAEGYMYRGLTSEPEEVTVYGTAETLAGLDSIVISSGELSLWGVTEGREVILDIRDFLPEGVGLVDETAANVIITLSVEESGTRTIEFPVESIQILHLAEGLRVEYPDLTDLTLRFTGSQTALDRLDLRDRVSMDLTDFRDTGTFEVPLSVRVPSGVALMTQSPVVRITISEQEGL